MKTGAKTIFAAVMFACVASTVVAQGLDVAKPDPIVESRLKGLAEELRCLVCQNQTIADSSAPLALDLRNQIRTMIGQGATDAQIRDYMVQRYGDFVLYKPPLQANTALLWIGPFAVLAVGIGAFLAIVRRRRTPQPQAAAGPGKLQDVERLLDD